MSGPIGDECMGQVHTPSTVTTERCHRTGRIMYRAIYKNPSCVTN